MSLIDEYKNRIQSSLSPTFLEVVDGSAAHRGHAGAQNAGPISHLGIRIQAKALQGLSPVAQHQKIYALFADELASGAIHALQIEVLSD